MFKPAQVFYFPFPAICEPTRPCIPITCCDPFYICRFRLSSSRRTRHKGGTVGLVTYSLNLSLICSICLQSHRITRTLPPTFHRTTRSETVPPRPRHTIACPRPRVRPSTSLNKPLKDLHRAILSSTKGLREDHSRHQGQCQKRDRACHRKSQPLLVIPRTCLYVSKHCHVITPGKC